MRKILVWTRTSLLDHLLSVLACYNYTIQTQLFAQVEISLVLFESPTADSPEITVIYVYAGKLLVVTL